MAVKRYISWVISLTVLLFYNSCLVPFEHETTEQIGNYEPDPGRGTVHLVIIGPSPVSLERTIFPDTPEFSSYRLSFTPLDNQTAKPDMEIFASGDTITDIDFEPGNWKITVYGRISVNEEETDVAEGSNEKVTVIAGKDITASVTLKSIAPGSGTGTFTWSIEFPQGIAVDSYSIVLSEWDNERKEPININTSTDDVTVSNSESVNAGYYLLRVSAGTDKQKVFYTDIVHIMADRTSEFKRRVLASEFIPVITLSGTVAVNLTINGSTVPNEIKEIWAYGSSGEKIAYADVIDNNWKMSMVKRDQPTDVSLGVKVKIAIQEIQENQEIPMELKSDITETVSTADIPGINISIDFAGIILSGTITPYTKGSISKDDWEVLAYTDPNNIAGTVINKGQSLTYGSGNWTIFAPVFETQTDVYFSVKETDGLYSRIDLRKTSVYNISIYDLAIPVYLDPPEKASITGTLPATENWSAPKPMIRSGDGNKFTFTASNLENITTYAIQFSGFFGLGGVKYEYSYDGIINDPGTGTESITYSPGENDAISWFNFNYNTLKFTLDFANPEYITTGKPRLLIENRHEVLIKGDSFIMGSPDTEKGRNGPDGLNGLSSETQHTVTLSSFYMMHTEVTQGNYESLMPVPVYKNTNGEFRNKDYPVVNISWLDAVEYANRLSDKDGLPRVYDIQGAEEARTVKADWNSPGWRLPTEAEWEFAARAGSTEAFAKLGEGDGKKLSTIMANYNGSQVDTNFGYNSDIGYREHIIAVTSFDANAFGLYNMHGNAWEFCWDWYADYNTSVVNNPHGYEAANDGWGNNKGNGAGGNQKTDDIGTRIIRGGSYCTPARYLRSAHRGTISPTKNTYNDIGFRLVRSAQ